MAMTSRTQMQMEDSFRAYLNEVGRQPSLDRDEELRLAECYRSHGDIEAGHALVRANLRYVVKIAQRFRGYGIRVADLVEEGNIGLLEAVKRFEPERGRRFMTYATYWIRAFILAHVLKQWSLVGVGTGPMQSKLFFRLARERARIAAVYGEVNNLNERLAESFGTTPDRIQAMAGRLDGKDHSLDHPLFADGPTTALDLLASPDEAVDERCADAERDRLVRDRVAVAARGLSPRERYIIERRLLTEEVSTLAEIGRDLGLSRERVRQLEERVKGKLGSALADLRDDPRAMELPRVA